MMTNTTKPELLDKVFQEVQKGLKQSLPWLDKAFGRAQRIIKQINGKNYYIPAVYLKNNDYIEVLPDSGIGNFSFFTVGDPQEIEREPKSRGVLKARFALIFWLDLRRISGAENRNTEFVKSEILKALSDMHLKCGRIEAEQIYEQAENIYNGFTIKEVDNQFLMHPFAGFKITGTINVNESC